LRKDIEIKEQIYTLKEIPYRFSNQTTITNDQIKT